MKFRNPFKGMAYITERGVQPEKILESYSVLPLKHLMNYLDEPINCFCAGRTGVGKTMLLSLFDPVFQKVLYSKTNDEQVTAERNRIIELMPQEIISVYSNLDSPHLRVTQFQGPVLNEESWVRCFGDYYGHILAKNLIFALEELSDIEKWRSDNKVVSFDKLTLDNISRSYAQKISKELPDSINISSWEELKKYIDNRISNWIQATNKLGAETFTGPTETVQLIIPILYLMEELKEKEIIGKNCRLFIVIDQYETLFEHRNNIDFRPLFNLAMKQSIRGQTRIEFKIGVRPYGYKDNLNIFQSGGKIDLEKEYQEIIIDDHVSKYYQDFIEDLTIKCLKKHTEYKKYANKENYQNLFVSLNPIDEVKEYIGKSVKNDNHFKLFFENINFKKETVVNTIEEITKNVPQIEYKVWLETLLAIHAERFFSKSSTKNIDLLKEDLIKHFKCLQSILGKKYVLSCESLDIEEIDKASRDKEYSTYKDISSGALFIVAASYKNKPKIYSGYDTLVTASSKIVLHYIEIVSEAFNSYIMEEPEEIETLSPMMQSDAVYKNSNRFFEMIPYRLPHGNSGKKFLEKLGVLCRLLQLDTTLNKPNPNGFSVVEDLTKIDLDSKNYEVISELLSYGYLEESKPDIKSSSRSKQYRYYLNRLLCPYFGISIIHKKSPVFVPDEKEFLRCLLEKNCSMEHLKKHFGLENSNISKNNKRRQKTLFDF